MIMAIRLLLTLSLFGATARAMVLVEEQLDDKSSELKAASREEVEQPVELLKKRSYEGLLKKSALTLHHANSFEQNPVAYRTNRLDNFTMKKERTTRFITRFDKDVCYCCCYDKPDTVLMFRTRRRPKPLFDTRETEQETYANSIENNVESWVFNIVSLIAGYLRVMLGEYGLCPGHFNIYNDPLYDTDRVRALVAINTPRPGVSITRGLIPEARITYTHRDNRDGLGEVLFHCEDIYILTDSGRLYYHRQDRTKMYPAERDTTQVRIPLAMRGQPWDLFVSQDEQYVWVVSDKELVRIDRKDNDKQETLLSIPESVQSLLGDEFVHTFTFAPDRESYVLLGGSKGSAFLADVRSGEFYLVVKAESTDIATIVGKQYLISKSGSSEIADMRWVKKDGRDEIIFITRDGTIKWHTITKIETEARE